MLHPTTRLLVAALIAALAGAAGLLVAWDGLSPAGGSRPAGEFQQLVGGLGMGPAIDLSRCARSLDPRLYPDCPLNHEPVPGGACFCPQHACGILTYPALDRRAYAAPLAGAVGPAGGGGDGRAP
jgi:hypothetical protein